MSTPTIIWLFRRAAYNAQVFLIAPSWASRDKEWQELIRFKPKKYQKLLKEFTPRGFKCPLANVIDLNATRESFVSSFAVQFAVTSLDGLGFRTLLSSKPIGKADIYYVILPVKTISKHTPQLPEWFVKFIKQKSQKTKIVIHLTGEFGNTKEWTDFCTFIKIPNRTTCLESPTKWSIPFLQKQKGSIVGPRHLKLANWKCYLSTNSTPIIAQKQNLTIINLPMPHIRTSFFLGKALGITVLDRPLDFLIKYGMDTAILNAGNAQKFEINVPKVSKSYELFIRTNKGKITRSRKKILNGETTIKMNLMQHDIAIIKFN